MNRQEKLLRYTAALGLAKRMKGILVDMAVDQKVRDSGDYLGFTWHASAFNAYECMRQELEGDYDKPQEDFWPVLEAALKQRESVAVATVKSGLTICSRCGKAYAIKSVHELAFCSNPERGVKHVNEQRRDDDPVPCSCGEGFDSGCSHGNDCRCLVCKGLII